MQNTPERREGREPERGGASVSVALHLVEEGSCTQEEATPASAAGSATRVTAVQGAVGEDKPAPAVTGSSASVLWD